MQTVKACTKCGEVKPLDGFHKDKSKRGGRRSHCKECMAEYRRPHREEMREYHRRYREENREYYRRYREENREKILEHNRRYREENREAILEHRRRYYEENREEMMEHQRRYYEENRKVMNAKTSSYYATNQEISKALSSVPPGTPWSEEEDAFLMADNGMTVYGKATHLGRTYGSCVHRHKTLKNLRRTTNV